MRLATSIACCSEVMMPFEPGVTGTPASIASRLAEALSPMLAIASGVGPMNWM